MAKEGLNNNSVGLITLVLVVALFVLSLVGMFPSDDSKLTKEDVASIVKNELAKVNVAWDAPAPQPAAPAPAPTPAPQPAAPSNIEVAELEDFYSDSYIKWSEDAKVTIIEFSDFECPFCARHATQGTLDQVIEKYGDDVNVVFSHFPLSFHPLAPDAQEAAECVGEQGGATAFYDFKEKLFAAGGKPDRATISNVLGQIDGIDAAAVETCIDDGTYTQKVNDMMAFGRQLGVTGTPGNIVMNNETGEFVKVSWAVPAASFDAAIGQFLGE